MIETLTSVILFILLAFSTGWNAYLARTLKTERRSLEMFKATIRAARLTEGATGFRSKVIVALHQLEKGHD